MSFLDQLVDLLPVAAVKPLTAEDRNVALIPGGPPPSVKQGPLQHSDAGPPGGEGPPQRVVAVLGPGATFAGIADTLTPFYATAASSGGPAAPTLDELARAIVVYATDYWAHHVVGLILPLPIEIDPTSGGWTVDADRIRALAASFNADWRPRLRTPPAAVDIQDALDLESAGAALAGELPVTDLAAQLWTQSLRNPFDAVLLFLAALRALDSAGAATAALAALSSATPAQLSVLAATRAGNGILRRLASLLGAPPTGADPAQVANAQVLLDNALHQGPAGTRTLVPHRDVPQTPAQQAVRRGTARATDGAAADPPGGLHQVVLGRDVAAGRPASARVDGTTYTGPAFAGRVDLPSYLTADADHLNATTDPALLTLLANSAGAGEADHVQRLDSVTARDANLVTVGLDQWGATADADLPTLLAAYKAAAPDEFDLFFALHGLDVQPGPAEGPAHQLLLIGPDGTGTVPDADALRAFFGGTADAHGAVTFSSDWAARFRLPALVSAAHRRVQVAQAVPRVARATDPVTRHAASVLPFPAAHYSFTEDPAASGRLAGFVTSKMTGGVRPAAAASVIGIARANGARAAETLAAAVVDLTAGTTTPAYAGFTDENGVVTDDETFFVGSLAKIMAMYAAHELRFRVQEVVTSLRRDRVAADPQTIFHAIGKAWRAQVCRTFPDFPELGVGPGRFPKLDKMFMIADNGTVRFLKGAATEADIAARGEFLTPTEQMTFYHWQKLMILYSNNTAAGLVISAIGYPYINRLLREAGFFPATKRGLWISGNYTSQDWTDHDVMPLTDRGKKHYKAKTNFAATAREVARLLTLAVLHKLCDEDTPTCNDMIELMRKNWIISLGPPIVRGGGDILGGPTGATFIGNAIGLTDPDTISSKIGLGDPPNPPNPPVPTDQRGAHDCAIVDRTEGGKAIRYVAVILGAYSKVPNSTAFNETARALDASVLAMH